MKGRRRKVSTRRPSIRACVSLRVKRGLVKSQRRGLAERSGASALFSVCQLGPRSRRTLITHGNDANDEASAVPGRQPARAKWSAKSWPCRDALMSGSCQSPFCRLGGQAVWFSGGANSRVPLSHGAWLENAAWSRKRLCGYVEASLANDDGAENASFRNRQRLVTVQG